MMSVWVAMFWTCFVRGLHIGGACSRDPYSAAGFDRLDYAAWCTLRILPRTIFPLLVSSV
jgi:hypothetical protein